MKKVKKTKMMNKILIAILFLFVFLSCTNSTKDNNTRVNQGKELRIVSLAASISDELVDLGLKNNIVGATSYCKVAQENKDLIIGSAIETNEEKIILLKPDIVCATSLTKQSTIDILKKNGLNVFMYDKAKSFDAISKNFLELGKKVHKLDLAKEIVNKAKAKIDSLKNLIPKVKNKPKILFQLGANPIATVIPGTYMDEFITLAGGVNLFYDMDKYIVSRESILLRNPDIIFITTMGTSGEAEKKNWLRYKELSAVKNDKIYLIDAGTASLPTVTNFVKTLEIMIKKMYF